MKGLTNTDFKGLSSLDEYIRALPTGGPTNVSTEPITPDTFYYDSNTKTTHVNSTSAKRGFFCVYFEKAQLGDIIEIECDYFSVSGVKPKVSIDEILNMSTPNTGVTVVEKQCMTGQWETLKLKFLVTSLRYSGDFKINFGVWTADVAEFYMRNARAKVTSKLRNDKPIPNFKKYTIRKNGEAWEIRKDAFLSDSGTLTVKDATTLLLRYDVPFDLPTTQRAPIAVASGDFAYSSSKYRPALGNALSTQLEIKLLNSSGTPVELATVENYTHFNIIVIG